MTGLIANALRKRCAPHTGVTPGQVAHAIGVARYTVDRWIQGASGPSAEAVGALAMFFQSHGDNQFLADCYRVQMAAAAPRTVCLVIDDRGAVHDAPHGHSAKLRELLGETGADLSDFACRMFGFVLPTIKSDLTATIRYTEGQTAKAAASRACALLAEKRDALRSVQRIVGAGHDWIAAAPSSADEAAKALALSAKLGVAKFEVERLPIGMADEWPEFRALLKADAQLARVGGARWIAASQAMPGRASLVDVEGDNVIVLRLGNRLGLDDDRQGKNVLAWPDTRYAEVTRHRMKEAREGATLYRLNVPLEGCQTDYLSLAIPDGESSVISASIIRHREGLAA